MLDVGEDAPEFELPNHRGEPVSHTDFTGQRLVVFFFPRANTDGCTAEAVGFRDERSSFDDREIAIVGISDDPVADLRRFVDEYDLSFDLLSDADGEVATLYESYGEKLAFGNRFDGVFRNTYVIGPSGRIEAVYDDVTPETHARDVLADFELARTPAASD